MKPIRSRLVRYALLAASAAALAGCPQSPRAVSNDGSSRLGTGTGMTDLDTTTDHTTGESPSYHAASAL
jgi:hypothetical protein